MSDEQWVPLRTRGAVIRWLIEHPWRSLSYPGGDAYGWFEDAGLVRFDQLGTPHETGVMTTDIGDVSKLTPLVIEMFEESNG